MNSASRPLSGNNVSRLLRRVVFGNASAMSDSSCRHLVTGFKNIGGTFADCSCANCCRLFPTGHVPLTLRLRTSQVGGLVFSSGRFAGRRRIIVRRQHRHASSGPLTGTCRSFQLLTLPSDPGNRSIVNPVDRLRSVALPRLGR